MVSENYLRNACQLSPTLLSNIKLRFDAWPCKLQNRTAVLPKANWARLEPPIGAVCPLDRTGPRGLRRAVAEIPWWHDTGAKCRAVLADLGAVVERRTAR